MEERSGRGERGRGPREGGGERERVSMVMEEGRMEEKGHMNVRNSIVRVLFLYGGVHAWK